MSRFLVFSVTFLTQAVAGAAAVVGFQREMVWSAPDAGVTSVCPRLDLPERTLSRVDGDMVPDVSGSRRFRFLPANGRAANISGQENIRAGGDGVLRARYELVADADTRIGEFFLSISLSGDMFGGGAICAGEKERAIPTNASKRYLPAIVGSFSNLTVRDSTGARWLRLSFPAPQSVTVRDARSWGRDVVSVRLNFADHGDIAKGAKFAVEFSVSASSPLVSSIDETRIAAGTKWIPMAIDDDVEPGSAMDFSVLAPAVAPAGRYGRLVARGECFEFEGLPGVPQRFYGNNISFDTCYFDGGLERKLAARLRLMGYNAVRFHHFDRTLTEDDPRHTCPSARRLAQLDGVMAALIDAGIMMSVDLYTGRNPPWRAVGIDRDGDMSQTAFKELMLFHEPTRRNWEENVRLFLSHVNPHTGRRYADEPAIAWLTFANEGNPGRSAAFSEPVKRVAAEAWRTWLADKKRVDPAWRNVPSEIPANIQARTPHAAAFMQFLVGCERALDVRLRAFVRDELGCKALLSSVNGGFNPPSLQRVREEVYDYVDDHFYIDHPVFARPPRGLPSICKGENPLASGGIPVVVTRRLFTKPFTVSEYNYSWPGRFRGVGGLLAGAVAARQNWAGVWRFCFGIGAQRMLAPGEFRMGYHDTLGDPLMQIGEAAFAALFVRGDMPALPEAAAIVLPPVATETLRDSPTAMNAVAWSDVAWRVRLGTSLGDPPPGVAAPWSYPAAYTMSAAEGRRLCPHAGDDGMVRAGGGGLAVATPRTCGMFAEKGVVCAGRIAADLGDVPATVFAVSMDGLPLEKSARILVAHLPDVQDTDTLFADKEFRYLRKPGRPPHLMAAARARVDLALSEAEYEIWALSSGGRRRARVPFERKDGRVAFAADVARDPASATWLYEIASFKKGKTK